MNPITFEKQINTNNQFKMKQRKDFSDIAETVISVSAETFAVDKEMVKSNSRKGRVSDCRKVVCLLLSGYSRMIYGRPNWTEIAKCLRLGMKHCSAYYLSNKAIDLISTEKFFEEKYMESKSKCEDELGLIIKQKNNWPVFGLTRKTLTDMGYDYRVLTDEAMNALCETIFRKHNTAFLNMVNSEATAMKLVKILVVPADI